MSTSLVSLASLVQAFNPVTPQLRVAAIIVRQHQLLLVEHRKRGQRYWVLPGARHCLREPGAGPPRRQPHFSGRDRGGGRAGARPSRSCARRLAVGVGGPAPPAGFPPTHCRSRARRHRRELCWPRPRARGYLEARVALSSSPASLQRRKVNILRTSQLGRGSETGGRRSGSPTSATVLEMRLDDLGERWPDVGQRRGGEDDRHQQHH